MEQLAGIIWDAAIRLFSCIKGQAAYVYKLKENVESLEGKWRELQNMYEDVHIRIQNAESTGEMQRKNEVNGWLQEVGNLGKEMKDILDYQEFHNSKNYVLRYKFGKKIVKMLKNVDEMLTKGKHFDSSDIAYKLPPKSVDEMPYTEAVGLDLMLKKIWNSIEEENVSIIGLYGMGGAGKTTLLNSIHNEFGKRKMDFDLVLWVVVSRDCDNNKIMNDIRNRIGIDDDIWNKSSQEQRVAKIYQVLKEKKFVLMLDDLWRKLELEKVGVPIPKETNNRSKVLFTTRLEDVCDKMQAQRKFKVECLLEREAFDLFCKKVGEETLKSHREIREVAWEMAKGCGGLPLALVTVGSAMAGVKSIAAWRQAKDFMNSAWIASDLEDNVYRILKFSYDKLPDEIHRDCFLYCALYPEDYEIDVDGLIDRWIGEGFLDKFKTKKSVYDMYEHGESIIEKLKLSCLLEGVENQKFWRSEVKMHDMIRDMAQWLACDQGGNNDKVLVEEKALAMSEMDPQKLKVVERISIINGRGDWQVPACPNLITLCVASRRIDITSYLNLRSMTRLKVLDLSGNPIEYLPTEICELINLEFLNLSIRKKLPIELKNLKNLKVLLMEGDGEFNLGMIPWEVIESLEQLKVFRVTGRSHMPISSFEGENVFVEKLESLPKLEELCCSLPTITSIHKLFGSAKLLGCLRQLILDSIKDPLEMAYLLESLSRMKHLDCIRLFYVDNIKEGLSNTYRCHLRNLRQVLVGNCNSITHLTWLRYAPLLERLVVHGCDSIEEVVKEAKYEDGDLNRDNINDVFPNLRRLILSELPKLKSIHERALTFPLLKYIIVHECPNLRKLPFKSSSASRDSLIVIEGESEWWNNLEWEDTAIKDLLDFQETW